MPQARRPSSPREQCREMHIRYSIPRASGKRSMADRSPPSKKPAQEQSPEEEQVQVAQHYTPYEPCIRLVYEIAFVYEPRTATSLVKSYHKPYKARKLGCILGSFWLDERLRHFTRLVFRSRKQASPRKLAYHPSLVYEGGNNQVILRAIYKYTTHDYMACKN